MVADSQVPKFQYPEWQADYQAALLELDPTKLPERIATAEGAIFQRLQSIAENANHCAERLAIQDALVSLRVLTREKLNYPDWEEKSKPLSE